MLRLLATQTANLFVSANLAGRLRISDKTVESYTRLLETVFLVKRLPAWRRGLGAREIQTKRGRAVYSRRKAIVEPVFGQIDTVQNGRRLLLRGKAAARGQWRFTCAVHNLLKLHRAGGLALIREPDTAPANAPAARQHPLATVVATIRSLIARFRRSLTESSAWNAPIAVTDPGS